MAVTCFRTPVSEKRSRPRLPLALFSIGKRYSFLRFLELLWSQSGGLCELTSFTAACEASRQTLANYLDIFAATGVVHVLRPFAMNPTREIVAMPKVYAFDTGFVCHTRSIDSLRVDDKGPLFEHLVLDELLFEAGAEEIHHWRDKQKHEIDFVWTPRGRSPVAIECQWRASRFDPTAMHSFATLHPKAAFWLVALIALPGDLVESGGEAGDVLLAGGKHHGHLEIDVTLAASGGWGVSITPACAFPLLSNPTAREPYRRTTSVRPGVQRRRTASTAGIRPATRRRQLAGSGTTAEYIDWARMACPAAVGWMPSQHKYCDGSAPGMAPEASLALMRP